MQSQAWKIDRYMYYLSCQYNYNHLCRASTTILFCVVPVQQYSIVSPQFNNNLFIIIFKEREAKEEKKYCENIGGPSSKY